MRYYIFHTLSKTLLYDSPTREQCNNEYQACLANESGTDSDFIVLEAEPPEQPGLIASLVNDRIVFITNPDLILQEAKKDLYLTGRAKLHKLAGLTDAESAAQP